MLNYLWLGLVLAAVILGGLNHQLQQVTDEAFAAAKTAVMTIALPLIGVTALWLGVVRLAERAGLIRTLAQALRPLLSRLFPDVPADHPAMGAMVMNFAANMLGLTNAATPLGLKAMAELEKLNLRPGTATNAMCTFLAINTSSLQLVPTTAIGIMAATGALQPTAIVGTTLLATACSTAAGILAVKLLARLPVFRLAPLTAPRPARDASTSVPDGQPEEPTAPPSPWPPVVAVALLLFFGWLGWSQFRAACVASPSAGWLRPAMDTLALLAIPFMLSFFPLYAAARGVRVYEEFVEGAKEGFQVAIRIIPYLVAMLVAVGMFRGAGGVAMVSKALAPVLDLLQFPAELLPMAITRPLSGSATIGLFSEIVSAHGPDSLLARMAGTLLGSTETTLYVVAVYFGAVGVKRARHAVWAGLLADAVGMLAAVWICRLVFGAH